MLSLPQVEFTPHYPYSYKDFSAFFQTQSADIFIAPLVDNLFNRCKSPLKFFEYSALGAPGVFSRLETYSDTVSHGKNGLLASSLDEWTDCLIQLIENDELRFQLATHAQATIRNHWLLSQNAFRWNAAFESAFEIINSNRGQDTQIVSIVRSINLQLFEAFQKLAEKEQSAQAFKALVSSISQSTSWKLTRPFREIKTLARKVITRARKAIAQIHLATKAKSEKKAPFHPRPTAKANKISVLVTSYNHERYIAQCLDSVLMQKGYYSLEIILGDDCSTDGTQAILARYREQHSDIIKMIANEKNLGVAKNLKRCLEACTGDYIAICEGDDYWTDEYKLQKQVEFLEDHPDCSMCFSALMLDYEDINYLAPHPDQQSLEKDVLTTEDLIGQNYIGNFSCCMYRTEVVRKLPDGIFDLFAALDWIFNMACSKIGKIGFIRDRMSVYRIHSRGAWSGKQEIEKLKEVRHMLDVYNAFLDYEYDAAFAKSKKVYDDEITRILGIQDNVKNSLKSQNT